MSCRAKTHFESVICYHTEIPSVNLYAKISPIFPIISVRFHSKYTNIHQSIHILGNALGTIFLRVL